MAIAIETLKRNTPRIILDAARRMPDHEVAHYPEVASRLARVRELDEKQSAARKRADTIKKTIDGIAERRAAAEEALRGARMARDKAAAEALLGDAEAEKEYHSASFKVTKAERSVAMFDFGSPRLVVEHEHAMTEFRRYGAQSATVAGELADEQFKARITESQRRNGAR